MPLFGTISMKDDGANKPDLHTWSSMRRTTGAEWPDVHTRIQARGQKPTICTRESNDGDKKAGCAPVNLGVSAGIGAL